MLFKLIFFFAILSRSLYAIEDTSFVSKIDKENLQILEIENKMMNKQNEKEVYFPRFVEEREKSIWDLPKTREPYEKQEFEGAWASSVYTEPNNVLTANFALKSEKYWLSSGKHLKTDIIEWKGWFRDMRRIKMIFLHWAKAPGQLAIHLSLDGENFQLFQEFKSIESDPNIRKMAKTFWWIRDGIESTVQLINFDFPIWVKAIKLLMRDNIFTYFGLYRVDMWSKMGTSIFRSRAKGGNDDCLVTANGLDFKDGNEVQLMNCVQAIQIMDGRELFYLENDYTITTYRNRKCIELYQGDTSPNAKIQTTNCQAAGGARDSRHLWRLSFDEKIRSLKDLNKCVTAYTGKEVSDILYMQEITATSEMNDGQHIAARAVDGDPETYWSSAPGEEEVTIKVMLKDQLTKTANQVKIKWKEPAKVFEVSVFRPFEIWETVQFFYKNELLENTIQLAPGNIRGVRVTIKKACETCLFNNKSVVSMYSLSVMCEVKGIKLQECSKGNRYRTNRFQIEDQDFNDVETKIGVEKEKKNLLSNANLDISLLRQIFPLLPNFIKLHRKAVELKQKMDKFEETFTTMDKDISYFKEDYLKTIVWLFPDKAKEIEIGKSKTIGVSSKVPAKSCRQIRKLSPAKNSGFYWVKTECTPMPIRVFCDFSTAKGVLYAFFGPVKEGKSLGKLASKEVIEFHCSRLGLEPVDFFDNSQIKAVGKYVKSLQLYLKGEVIPLAIDYGCLAGTCKQIYQSINNQGSKDITSALIPQLDPNNLSNMDFSSGSTVRSGIGFGMNNGKLQYFQFGTTPIKGILCSDNSYNTKPSFLPITCSTVARGSSNFAAIQNTIIKVICPPQCAVVKTAKVWGSAIYKDDSSICRAALHAGAISNAKGGKVMISIEKGASSYKGSIENDIASEDYINTWDRSFLINKYVEKCPIEKFKNRMTEFMTSFLQKNRTVTLKKLLKRKHFSSLIETNEKIGSKILSYFSPSGSGSGSENNPEEETIEYKGLIGTAEAVSQMIQIYALERTVLRKYVKLAKDVEVFLIEIKKIIATLTNTDLNNQLLKKKLELCVEHLKGTKEMEDQMIKEAETRIKLTYRKYQLMRLEKLKVMKWMDYIEVYDYLLHDMYFVFDNPKAIDGPTNWVMENTNLEGHGMSISQTKPIYCVPDDDCIAGILILKYKKFYDSKFYASVLMMDNGICGLIFRYKDPFNFYVFEMRQTSPSFKRVRRVIRGKSEIIAEKNDGGYKQEVWYRILIVQTIGVFEIKMQEEKQVLKDQEEMMPTVLKAEDQIYVRGHIGFHVNQMGGFYIDKIKYSTFPCQKEKAVSQTKLVGPEGSRFVETYFGQLNLRWKTVDPVDYVNGPSVWKFAQNFHKSDKECKSGLIKFKFLALDEGIVGFLFRYYNSRFYYILEFSGSNNKYVAFKKFVGGKSKEIIRDKKFGYEKNQWVHVDFYMKGSIFRIFAKYDKKGQVIILNFKNKKQLFNQDVEDEELGTGTIGFSTFLTRAGFDNISMRPLYDLEPTEDDVYKKEDKTLDKLKGGVKTGKKYGQTNMPENTEKQLSWEICLTYKTKSERASHCERLLEFDVMAQYMCIDNYCTFCCEKEIDALHPVQRFNCQKDCNGEDIEEEKPVWQGCIASVNPKKSVYNFCDVTFTEQIQKDNCKVNLCDLCCTTSTVIFKVTLSDKAILDCHKQCRETYEKRFDYFAK